MLTTRHRGHHTDYKTLVIMLTKRHSGYHADWANDRRRGTGVMTKLRRVLGDSGGVVNSHDFCPTSLKSLGCFYFRYVLSSQWKALTVNL